MGEPVEAAPYLQQAVTGAIVGFGGLVAMWFRFRNGIKKEEQTKVVVDNGTAADLKPFREDLMKMRQYLEDIRDNTLELVEIAKKAETEEAIHKLALIEAERIVARREASYEDHMNRKMGRVLNQLPPGES